MVNVSKRWLLVGLSALLVMALSGCGGQESQPQTTEPEATETEQPSVDESPTTPPATEEEATELKIEDKKKGTGAEATAGKTVTVHYTGWLTDGTKFDSSKDSGQPYTFPLGQGQVIPGWDQGVQGMKVGGVRKLTIPPALGYGEQGAGGGVIPPNATLIFEVELLDVQ